MFENPAFKSIFTSIILTFLLLNKTINYKAKTNKKAIRKWV